MGKKIISTYTTGQVTNATKLLATTNGTTHLVNAESLVDVSEKIVDDVSFWAQGNMSISNNLTSDTNRIRTKHTLTKADMNIQDVVNVKYLNPNFQYRVIFSSSATGNVIEGGVVESWSTTPKVYVVPQGANYCHICLARIDSADFTPADGYDKIKVYNGTKILEDNIGHRLDVLEKKVKSTQNRLFADKSWWLLKNVNSAYNYLNGTNRICTNKENKLEDFGIKSWIHVDVDDEYDYRLVFADTNMTCINSSEGWNTDGGKSYSVPNNAVYFAIGIRKHDDSDITIEDTFYRVRIYADCSVLFSYSNLVNIVGNLNGKVISILGDSISTFTGYSYSGNRCRYPQDNLLTDVNDTYWMKVINQLGMTLGINEAWAGTRISWDGTTESGDIGADKFIGSQTRINHLGENGTPNIILVFGGTNDINNGVTLGTFDTTDPSAYTQTQIDALTSETFGKAVRTLFIRIQHTYPLARVVCILPYFFGNANTLDSYNEILKEACDYFGVKIVDARTCGLNPFNKSNYLPDNLHLNADGMELLANVLKKSLMELF